MSGRATWQAEETGVPKLVSRKSAQCVVEAAGALVFASASTVSELTTHVKALTLDLSNPGSRRGSRRWVRMRVWAVTCEWGLAGAGVDGEVT